MSFERPISGSCGCRNAPGYSADRGSVHFSAAHYQWLLRRGKSELFRFIKIGLRLRVIPLLAVAEATVVVRTAIIWVHSDRLAEFADRVAVVLPTVVVYAQVVVVCGG